MPLFFAYKDEDDDEEWQRRHRITNYNSIQIQF